MRRTTNDDLQALRRNLDGELVEPDDPRFGQLPRPNNARFDSLRPLAVVLCQSPRDVETAIAFIHKQGLESAVRCGGHCFAGRSSTRGILVDVSRLNSVSIADGLATIAAGAVLGEVYPRLLAEQQTIPAGTCPSTGIAGLTLGGGLGMLGRVHGLASDHLVACQVVLPDGMSIRCDEHNDAELFWALRGAGSGNFGVVTEFTFRPIHPPAVVTSFSVTWPFSAAAAVVLAWLRSAIEFPDEISASLDLTTSENLDEPASAEVFGIVLGSRSEAVTALNRLVLQARSDPASTVLTEGSYLDALRYWAQRANEDLDNPRAGSGARHVEIIKSEFFKQPLSSDAVAAIVENIEASRGAGESRNVDFSPWGGAYNRVSADATAFTHRNALFWIKHTAALSVTASSAQIANATSWVNRSWRLARPWGTGGVFPNFPDPDLGDWGPAYYGSNYERLVRAKARYDPDNVFRFHQSLPVSL